MPNLNIKINTLNKGNINYTNTLAHPNYKSLYLSSQLRTENGAVLELSERFLGHERMELN